MRTLIRNAQLLGDGVADVRLANGMVYAIGSLHADPGERLIDATGGVLLPGLHDHHLHIPAAASALRSVACGPPAVVDATALAERLAVPGTDWLRGTGYHESVAGLIDRHWLDAPAPTRPVRIQHRSGRMWIFNTSGLERLLATGDTLPPGLERDAGGGWTGRLFDEDDWLRTALGGDIPCFAAVGADLARHGVTGVTDMTPTNDDVMAAHFADQRAQRALPQRIVLAGRQELGTGDFPHDIVLGPVKVHLHDAHLPPLDDIVSTIRYAHGAGRTTAVHCVTEGELVFALAAFDEVGTMSGDRIEHASITPRWAIDTIAQLGLHVVTQPNFVAERGDAYRAAMSSADWPNLYRLQSLAAAGITLAAGSDAPFGRNDPWAAMAAAVARRTPDGATLGASEALSPEQALDLYLADPADLRRTRAVKVGMPADLCLLKRPWHHVRETLAANNVAATLIGGDIVYRQGDDARPVA